MRKSEKEITGRTEIDEIISQAPVCRIALSDNDTPYIVPVCFGCEQDTLFFHTAPEGRKLDILKKNDRVSFEMDIDIELSVGRNACSWGMKYRSVIGYGKASIVKDPAEKLKGLNAIMRHYGGPVDSYSQKELDRTLVIKVEIDSLTGKKSV